jgi:anti-sigma B factor antagonist
MEIKVSKNSDNDYLLELSGDMDLMGSNQLKDIVMKLIANRIEKFIINLKNVGDINSTGVGALIYISSTLKKLNCPLIIIVSDGAVLSALEETRLKGYFTIVQSLKEALEK